MAEIKTPMLEKMRLVKEQSQTIGEFLEYMSERGYVMCQEADREPYYLPTRLNTERMLALFFEIDLVKAEEERQALLDSIR